MDLAIEVLAAYAERRHADPSTVVELATRVRHASSAEDRTSEDATLVVLLARAVTAAAVEGRLDVVNELAVLLVRLGAEDRQRVHREAGIVSLDLKTR